MGTDGLHDVAIRCQVNPKGLFAEQMFASLDDIAVEPLVQIVRYCAVDGIDLRAI